MGRPPKVSLVDALDELDPDTTHQAPHGATLVGLSLSRCIADMIKDPALLPRVKKIVSNTCCETESQFSDVLDVYEKTYWASNPSWARLTALSLYHAGRIYQPRIEERSHQMPAGNPDWETQLLPSCWWVTNLDYRKHLVQKLRDLLDQMKNPHV